MSLASAELELANIALEDIILAELNGEQISRDGLMSHLQLSLASLREARRVVGGLRHGMKANAYKDLPPLHALDLIEIGTQMAHQGLVELNSWEKMGEMMKRGRGKPIFQFQGFLRSFIHRLVFVPRSFLGFQPTLDRNLVCLHGLWFTRQREKNFCLKEKRNNNHRLTPGVYYSIAFLIWSSVR